jgi:hypothetical protein
LAEILGWIWILLRPVDPDLVGYGLGDGPSVHDSLAEAAAHWALGLGRGGFRLVGRACGMVDTLGRPDCLERCGVSQHHWHVGHAEPAPRPFKSRVDTSVAFVDLDVDVSIALCTAAARLDTHAAVQLARVQCYVGGVQAEV